MAIVQKYRDYLAHFGATVPVREYARNIEAPAVALRHDVDYDLDIALEMAFWEAEAGARSSYYILHTAPYMEDPRLIDKLLQLQDFGHEVGLHTNFLTRWMETPELDPDQELRALLERLRDGGVDLRGMSAHGDRCCYTHGFINYWMFRELRGEAPEQYENGRTAEGIVTENPSHQISYPADHVLRSPDGRSLPLWQSSMRDLELDYDAIHVPGDLYFSDSGGGWIRTGDPLNADLSRQRVQILMHPLYWNEPGKLYFFLSTARSGSKWLATVLDQASSVKAQHEFMLNNTYHDGEVKSEHRTGPGFSGLSEAPAEAQALIETMHPWLDDLNRDYAEVNVYLPFFLSQLKQTFPQANYVFLRRDPAKIFRSIVNRGWYDTVHDKAHGRVPVAEWESLDQYGRCAAYVGWTQNLLSSECGYEITLEEVTGQPDKLRDHLKSLGIAYYPRLARDLVGQVINANKDADFLPATQWPPAATDAFTRWCGSAGAALYPGTSPLQKLIAGVGDATAALRRRWRTGLISGTVESWREVPLGNAGGTVDWTDGELLFTPGHARHAFVLFGSKSWGTPSGKPGWRVAPSAEVTGFITLDGDFPPGALLRIMMLGYDDNKLVEKRVLAVLGESTDNQGFGCRPKFRSKRIAIALHMPTDCQPNWIRIRDFGVSFGT